jgi:hypothetical protein
MLKDSVWPGPQPRTGDLQASGGQYSAKPTFESMLPEELCELKNEETIKKSENLFITTMHGPIQSRETAPLKENSLQTYVEGFRVAGTTAPNG